MHDETACRKLEPETLNIILHPTEYFMIASTRCYRRAILFLLLLGGIITPVARGADDALDLGALGGPADTAVNRDDPVKSLLDEAGPGDKKRFNIKTETDISNLKKDDLYTDGLKSYFRVTDVAPRDGSFEVERVAGTNNPDRKFQRVRAVDEKNPGPPTIEVRVTLLDLIHTGGWPVYMIMGLAAILIMLSFNCLMLYRRSRQCPPAFVREATEALDKQEIERFEQAALKSRGLLPHVCLAMTERFDSSTQEYIERRCETAAAGRINTLRTPAKLINVIFVAAPLIGLFGTIVGMVVVFEAVAGTAGAAKATALAAGIRVKLFSTAAALLVAIPGLFAYFFFSTMLGNVIAETERLSEQFLHAVLVVKRKKQAAARKASRKESELVAEKVEA